MWFVPTLLRSWGSGLKGRRVDTINLLGSSDGRTGSQLPARSAKCSRSRSRSSARGAHSPQASPAARASPPIGRATAPPHTGGANRRGTAAAGRGRGAAAARHVLCQGTQLVRAAARGKRRCCLTFQTKRCRTSRCVSTQLNIPPCCFDFCLLGDACGCGAVVQKAYAAGATCAVWGARPIHGSGRSGAAGAERAPSPPLRPRSLCAGVGVAAPPRRRAVRRVARRPARQRAAAAAPARLHSGRRQHGRQRGLRSGRAAAPHLPDRARRRGDVPRPWAGAPRRAPRVAADWSHESGARSQGPEGAAHPSACSCQDPTSPLLRLESRPHTWSSPCAPTHY